MNLKIGSIVRIKDDDMGYGIGHVHSIDNEIPVTDGPFVSVMFPRASGETETIDVTSIHDDFEEVFECDLKQ